MLFFGETPQLLIFQNLKLCWNCQADLYLNKQVHLLAGLCKQYCSPVFWSWLVIERVLLGGTSHCRRNWVTGQDVRGPVWKDQRLDAQAWNPQLSCFHVDKLINLWPKWWNAFIAIVVRSRHSKPGSSCVFPQKCWVQTLSPPNLTSDILLDLSSVSIRYSDRFEQTTGGLPQNTVYAPSCRFMCENWETITGWEVVFSTSRWSSYFTRAADLLTAALF